MLFKYIAFHYLKNMLIILMGLTGLFAGLDFLINGSSLPSFNIQILYIFNKWQESLNLLYPLAIIFGGIWTKIDFIKKRDIIEIHEVKKGKQMEKAHIMQALYYIYYLNNLGIKAKAILHYPKLRETKEIELKESDKEEIKRAIKEIEHIKSLKEPPAPIYQKICKNR